MLPIHNYRATDFLTASASGSRFINLEGDLAVNHVGGVWRTRLPLRLRGPFEARERWREVSLAQFEAFLRAHPRSFEQRPRIAGKSGHREWMDTTLSSWPANTVAEAWTQGRNRSYQIRTV